MPNFRLSFSVFGPAHVEPAFANIIEQDGSDVHGVAFWYGAHFDAYMQALVILVVICLTTHGF